MSLRDDLDLISGAGLESVGREQPKARISWSPASLLEAAHKNYLRGLTLCETTTDFSHDMCVLLSCLVFCFLIVVRCNNLKQHKNV